MKYKILAFLLLLVAVPCFADDLNDDFADVIMDSGEDNLNLDPISLNPGASGINVSGFDIAGLLLGMQYEDVHTLFFDGGSLYTPLKQNGIIYTMHRDWKYNLDYECRQQNIVVPADLEKCINSLARNRGLLYASEIRLQRVSTGETIAVYLTSNATENRVWRVVYRNDVDELEGTTPKFEHQRDNKILFWWQGVLDKYGAPNAGPDKWATSTSAYDPIMTAYYGSLELVDEGLHASDEALNIQQARENFKPKSYSF